MKVTSPHVPEPMVDPDRLAAVEERFLRDCVRPVRTITVPQDIFQRATPRRGRRESLFR